MTSDPFLGNAVFAVSDGGTLVYAPGSSRSNESFLSVMSADGRKERRGIPAAVYRALRFSPDGATLAMELRRGRDWDLWLYDWARDAASRFTSDPAEDRDPIFTPDGRRITFSSTRGDLATHNLYWQRTDGTGVAERLTKSESEQVPNFWHPGGRVLAFTDYPPGKSGDIWTLELEGDEATGFKARAPQPLVNSSFHERDAAFSPDGRWLAYTSYESGQAEVYVRPYPGPGGRWQVSAGNNHWPTWSKRRKELLFLAAEGSQLMVAGFTTVGDTFRPDRPRPWLPGLPPRWQHGRSFDLHPDGQRLALLEPVEEGAGRIDHVVLVQNFFEELRRLAPVPAR
jgi:serine/threonine-protein kinase